MNQETKKLFAHYMTNFGFSFLILACILGLTALYRFPSQDHGLLNLFYVLTSMGLGSLIIGAIMLDIVNKKTKRTRR